MIDKTETPLMRKIRLLMAKAQGTTNENEAAAFAEKVQQMLLENGLSAADIDTSAGQRPEEVAEHAPDARGGRDFLKSPARRILMGAVCKFYMCSYLRWGSERLVVVGKRANAEVAVEMMNYLLATTVRLSNEYARAQGSRSGSAVATDFRKGCMLRLAERLDSLRRERERAAQRPQTGSNLPALFVGESQLVAEYIKNRGVRSGRPVRMKVGDHATAGRRAADGIGLQPQVRSSAPESRRIAK
jgi:hypothetical protein